MQDTSNNAIWRVTQPWTMQTDKYLSSENAPEIEENVRLCLTSGADALVLDCAPLVYMTSAGLRAVLAMAHRAKQQNSHFSVKNLSGQPSEIFHACGADAFIASNDTAPPFIHAA